MKTLRYVFLVSEVFTDREGMKTLVSTFIHQVAIDCGATVDFDAEDGTHRYLEVHCKSNTILAKVLDATANLNGVKVWSPQNRPTVSPSDDEPQQEPAV